MVFHELLHFQTHFFWQSGNFSCQRATKADNIRRLSKVQVWRKVEIQSFPGRFLWIFLNRLELRGEGVAISLDNGNTQVSFAREVMNDAWLFYANPCGDVLERHC